MIYFPIKDVVSPNLLNNHFANLAERIINNDKWKENDLEALNKFCESKKIKTNLSIPLITVSDVYEALVHLKQPKTMDLDLLDSKIIKLAAPVITDSLTYIYNLCTDKTIFPFSLETSTSYSAF